MTDTPERIWAKPIFDSWGAYGHWYRDSAGGGDEYILTTTYQSALDRIAEQGKRIAELEGALRGMLDHVAGEEFCLCEYKDHTEPADEGAAVNASRAALSPNTTGEATTEGGYRYIEDQVDGETEEALVGLNEGIALAKKAGIEGGGINIFLDGYFASRKADQEATTEGSAV